MKTKIFVAALLATFAVPAFATALVVNSGWQNDEDDILGQPTINSPWTFTISSGATFSVVDCCVPGDDYSLSGDSNATSTFTPGLATDIRATGSYGQYWADGAYSRISVFFGPGTYSITITGDGIGGIPAGLGVRLDSAVPEPASWAFMLAGFGLIGTAMRRRSGVVTA
jgi:hypothetical protein